MKKKLFIVPNNDAEALRIQQLIRENNTEGNYEVVLTGQNWGASWENLESDIKEIIAQQDKKLTDVYLVEIKGAPADSGIISIDHHAYYDVDEKSAIGEKTSIEQVADILEVPLSVFDKMVAANDVGYVHRMNKLAEDLKISDEEKTEICLEVDRLESLAKTIIEMGTGNVPFEQIPDIESYAEESKKNRVEKAQKAIDNGYVYDDRLIIINLDDFDCQREVTNILYRMGKYSNMLYNNILVVSRDKEDNKRIVYFGNGQIIDALNDEFKDEKIRWRGGEEEAGFWGIQNSKGENFEEISDSVINFLELKVLKYHRLVNPEDIIKSEETPQYGPNIRVHEISNPETFHSAITASQSNNDHNTFVHIYDAEEYANKRLFLVNAGCAGCAVTSSGDIESVFKNDYMAKQDDVAKITGALLLTAIENGGDRLDCFDGFLPKNYMKFGFIPVCKVAFNDEFAPENWNYERDGRPDIVFFAHNGDSVEKILDKRNNGGYELLDLTSIPMIEDYDDAVVFRDAYIDDRKQEKNKKGGNIMSGYKIMMGVVNGYGGENLSPEETMKLGKKTVGANLGENVDVRLASAVYSENFGCPQGGELGISFSGQVENREELIEQVKAMMKTLGQSTVTIEWTEEGKNAGSTYISDKGEKVSNNQAIDGIESFSVKIPADEIGFQQLGKKLQDALETVNGFQRSENDTPMYMISGVLTEGQTKDGKKYYEYGATQNSMYGQTDNGVYQKSALMTVAMATKGLGKKVVEFNNESVVLENEFIEHKRETGIER